MTTWEIPTTKTEYARHVQRRVDLTEELGWTARRYTLSRHGIELFASGKRWPSIVNRFGRELDVDDRHVVGPADNLIVSGFPPAPQARRMRNHYGCIVPPQVSADEFEDYWMVRRTGVSIDDTLIVLPRLRALGWAGGEAARLFVDIARGGNLSPVEVVETVEATMA